jgi:hypothetical protein
MKALLTLFIILSLVSFAGISKGGEEAGAIKSEIESRVYPIAPGVWYPGDPLPENPIRYYRVRCWPGCHRGSSFGQYPHEPLNMRPIFPTSTLDRSPALSSQSE